VAELAALPAMTKDDLMDNWNEIVTEPRLKLADVEKFLDRLEGDDYLLESFHACASGGSSGRQGVIVFDWDAWTTVYAATVRHSIRDVMQDPELAGAPKVMAVVAADRSTHITAAANQTFSTGMMQTHRLPVTMPFEQIVAGLNELQPTYLFGYASVLCRLAREAEAGRLRIAPRRLSPTAEPLLPEMRQLLEETWRVPVNNHWASTEGGLMGVGTARSPHMILSDDLLILRAVDAEGREVPAGTTSTKVHLTNLFNVALPLINYEITDELTVVDEPCPYGSGYRLAADVLGRADQDFRYTGGCVVQWFTFRSALSKHRNILEVQVRQTEAGAELLFRASGEVETDRLAADLVDRLATAGVTDPEITLRVVDEIPADPGGKVKRFVPLQQPD
jgi:phenylacetate-coenzyme A ligase PaaK-like adenylate-forming protein